MVTTASGHDCARRCLNNEGAKNQKGSIPFCKDAFVIFLESWLTGNWMKEMPRYEGLVDYERLMIGCYVVENRPIILDIIFHEFRRDVGGEKADTPFTTKCGFCFSNTTFRTFIYN